MDVEYNQPWSEATPVDDMKRRLGLNIPQLLGPIASLRQQPPAANPAPPLAASPSQDSSLAVKPVEQRPLAEVATNRNSLGERNVNVSPTGDHGGVSRPAPGTASAEASKRPLAVAPLSQQYGDLEAKISDLKQPTPNDPAYKVPTWKKILGVPLSIAAGIKEPRQAGEAYSGILRGPYDRAEAEYERNKSSLEGQAKAIQTQSGIANTESEIAARQNPKPEKPENLQQSYADAVTDAQSRGVDPAKDPKVQQIADAITALQKQPAAPKESKAVAGVLNGKPAWGVQTEKGWIDPQTQQSIPGFQPAPSFAETGLYEPVELPAPGGGMQPGSFDKRTGKTKPMAPGQTAIPKPAQTEIDKSLSAARDADNRYKTMTQNQADALKGNQQAMLSLVANHIGMTLGAQKGARINQAVWEEAIKSTPWLQRVEAKFDSRGYLSGVTLTPDQIKQMTDLAKQKREIVWQQAKQTANQYGVGDTVKMPSDLASQTGGFKPF